MGNIEINGCCTLRKAFNIFQVGRVDAVTFDNTFVEQISAQNYQEHRPDHEYWLILSVLCPTLVQPPVQDKYAVVGVWRYHENPCGALVCIRVLLDNHILAFLCEEATLGPASDPVRRHGPPQIEVLEMPFKPCASLFPLLSEGHTFTWPRLRLSMGTLPTRDRDAILQALRNIPISNKHVLGRSCYQRPSLRCKVRGRASCTSGECCLVCFEKPAVVQFRQCKHVVTCVDCAVSVKKCPQCRTPITIGDRLMLQPDDPGKGSILLYNPIWIVNFSDWEAVKVAFHEKKMFSTLAHAMLTNQTVFRVIEKTICCKHGTAKLSRGYSAPQCCLAVRWGHWL